jgi:large repetitive protein
MSARARLNPLTFPIIVLAITSSGCGGSGSNSKPAISVSVSPSAAQSIDQGQQIKFTAALTNDTSSQGVTWSVTGQGALAGQTTTAATFVAPTSGASGSATVTATSVANTSATASVKVTIAQPPSIATTSLPSATLGAAYSQTIAAKGGTGALSYSVSSGSLPTGLSLSGSTGAITGTPSGASGTSTFTVKVTDSSTAGGVSATQPLNIPVSILTVTTNSLPSGSVGGAYNGALASTGGLAPITWSVIGGTLPAGLTLNTATGAITGTPTAAATSSITVQAGDSSSPQQTAKATLNLTVAQLMITTTSLLNPMVGEAYNQSLLYTDSGGTLPVTWSIASGTLPSGFTLNPSTGAITGTATSSEVGTSNFTVQVTDSSAPAQTATQALSLTITTATACGSGSESLLTGQYAMSLTGFDASGPAGILASFTANGSGGITSGYEDLNSAGPSGVQPNVAVTAAGSSYSIGSDRRGCLTLVTSAGTRVFRIAVGIINSGVATIGRSIEFDNTGTNVAGTIQIQQSSAFSNAQVTGNFAFVAESPITSGAGGGFFAAVGALNLSGSTVTGVGDMNINGSMDPGNSAYPASPMTFTSGTYNIGSNGRGTLSFSVPINGTPTSINLVVYVLNSIQVYFMSGSAQSTTNPAINLFAGFAGQQTGLPYSTSSLNSACIMFASGQASPGATASRVQAGVLSPDGNGNFAFIGDLNSAGAVSSLTSAGSYAVSSNGRVLLTNSGGTSPGQVMYLVDPSNEGYFLSTDNYAMLGNAEPEAGLPFSNATLNGTYTFGSIVPVVAGSPFTAGQATYDGAGNVSITYDVNEGGFLSLDNVSTATYSASPNGRVVSPAGGTTLTVSYIKFSGTVVSFGYSSTDTDPTLQVMDQ